MTGGAGKHPSGGLGQAVPEWSTARADTNEGGYQ